MFSTDNARLQFLQAIQGNVYAPLKILSKSSVVRVKVQVFQLKDVSLIQYQINLTE